MFFAAQTAEIRKVVKKVVVGTSLEAFLLQRGRN